VDWFVPFLYIKEILKVVEVALVEPFSKRQKRHVALVYRIGKLGIVASISKEWNKRDFINFNVYYIVVYVAYIRIRACL